MEAIVTSTTGTCFHRSEWRPRPALGAHMLAAAALLPILLTLAPACVLGGPGLTEDIKHFPGGAFPAFGRFSDTCGLQCRMGALSNGDRGIRVGGSLYPWGKRTCGAWIDSMAVASTTSSDFDGLSAMREEEAGLAARVYALARTRGTSRGRAVETDEQYYPREFHSGLCPVQRQALFHETLSLDMLGLQRNSILGKVTRNIGTYDVIGYRYVLAGKAVMSAMTSVTFRGGLDSSRGSGSKRQAQPTAADHPSLCACLLIFCLMSCCSLRILSVRSLPPHFSFLLPWALGNVVVVARRWESAAPPLVMMRRPSTRRAKNRAALRA